MDIFKNFLPPQVQKLLPQIEELLKDKAIVDDLIVVFEEMEKEIGIASKKPTTDKKLRNAFNDAATIVSVGKNYLKNGSVSVLAIAKLAGSKGRMKDNAGFLVAAFREKQPSTTVFTQSLKENTAFSDAIKRLVVKADGVLFCLEDGENGQGYAVELLTGQSIKVLLEKADYEEIKKALNAGKSPPAPPAPPKGPEI